MSTDFITYEFKIKQAGVPWEETPVEFTLNTLPRYMQGAQDFAKLSANFTHRAVRWNAQGSLQGHYVHPQME